jgi:hypothetical protein
VPRGAEFLERWRGFMEAYGHQARGADGIAVVEAGPLCSRDLRILTQVDLGLPDLGGGELAIEGRLELGGLGEKELGVDGVAHGLAHVALRYFNAAGADPEGEIGEAHRSVTTALMPCLRPFSLIPAPRALAH